jgi:hypothetical protein
LELGLVSSVDSKGRTIWIADAHRGDGKRFVVHAGEKLTAFLELESAIRRVRCSKTLKEEKQSNSSTNEQNLNEKS